MHKEIDVKKSKATYIILIVAFLLWLPFFFVLSQAENDPIIRLITSAIVLVALFTDKYIHEFCHYVVNRALGFECKVKFGLLMSECKVFGTQTYKQVILGSAAPLLYYIPVSVLVLVSNIAVPYKWVFLSVLILWLSSMAGDYQYIYHALSNKDAVFNDNGTVLVISKAQ